VSSCPQCRALHRPQQEYCVECGHPLRTPTKLEMLRSRHAGNAVLPLLAVLLLAAVGALVAIAVSRDNGTTTIVATNIPERTTVIKPPVFGTTTVATTVPPVVTSAQPPRPSALTQWTLADGYTLVLATIPLANGRASAVQIAKRALEQGLPDVGIIDTRRFSGLAPGYFAVFSGVYESNADAAANIEQAQQAGFVAPYARRVTR
jgi:hypothetical protein